MRTYPLGGFRADPASSKHWSYEALLKPKMVVGGDPEPDLRPFSSPRHDQQWTNSCVANSTVKALEIKRIQKYGHAAHVDLSRMAVYYLAREMMKPPETHVDDGTYIGHAFDALRRFGVPPEKDWPFDPDKINTPPSFMAMRKAYLTKVKAFYQIQSTGNNRVDEVINCLRAGNPVVFGTNVDRAWSMHWKENGPLRPLMPVAEDAKRGRHAIVIVGFVGGNFIIENSWGAYWGEDGFGIVAPETIASPVSKSFWVPQAGWEPFKE